MDSSSVLGTFGIDTEVLDVGNRDVIFGLFSFTENVFTGNTPCRCWRNVNTGQVIPCSIGQIQKVLIMEEELLEER